MSTLRILIFSNMHIQNEVHNVKKSDTIFLENASSRGIWSLYFRVNNINEEKLNITYITDKEFWNLKLENNMKFDVGLLNPPYKQGLFRDFMIKVLEDLIKDNGQVIQISPDETSPLNNKNHKTLPAMKKYGLQEIEDCSSDYPSVITSAPIVKYYFDLSKEHNPDVFDKEISEEEKITLSIVEKIKNKQVHGVLSQSTTGELDNKLTNEVNALVRITKKGPEYEIMPRNETRYISNSDNYIFTNMFIGVNKGDSVVKGKGQMYIGRKNIFAIGNTESFTENDFVDLYLHPTMRFFLKFLRGYNNRTLGIHLRQLPLMPLNIDVDEYLELTEQEIEHIKNELDTNY